jgi:lipoate-protein ligase B
MRILWWADLGTIEYEECTELQKKLVRLRHEGRIEDTLLLLEHPPVITVGTSGGEGNLIASPETVERAGVQVCKTDRGGNITYHGPGQIVGYPIFDLRQHGRDVHLFLRTLEQAVTDFLADYGIAGERVEGLTGVWVDGDKICSIGVAVRRWISYHGFALNIDPDFRHWALLHPCGLIGKQVTSLTRLTGQPADMDTVKRAMLLNLAALFEAESRQVERGMLEELTRT